MTILRRFIEGRCDPAVLAIGREKLKPKIVAAELAPRSMRPVEDPDAANTAQYYDDYVEHWLKGRRRGTPALNPRQMIGCMTDALRAYAISSCDGDPSGAVPGAIQEAAEEVHALLPTLEGVALRLNAGPAMQERGTRCHALNVCPFLGSCGATEFRAPRGSHAPWVRTRPRDLTPSQPATWPAPARRTSPGRRWPASPRAPRGKGQAHLTVFLSREQAERLTARAIRRRKNLAALVTEILEAEKG